MARYAYDAGAIPLYVEFRSGGAGYYSHVPQEVFDLVLRQIGTTRN